MKERKTPVYQGFYALFLSYGNRFAANPELLTFGNDTIDLK
jgi:hypothetical protein